MLELMCETVVHVIEATWRTVAGRSSGRGDAMSTILLLLLVRVRVVVEIALIRDTACGLLCAPDLLLSVAVGEGLREGGRGSGEGTTLLACKGLLVVEAEVQVEAVGVAVIWLLSLSLSLALALALVRHGGRWLWL